MKKIIYLCSGVGVVALVMLGVTYLNTQSNTLTNENNEVIEVFNPSLPKGENETTETINLDTEVNVKDLILLQVINRTLDRPSQTPVTVGDMQSLNTLVCTNCGINDLSGLEYATNLTSLELHGNYITDLAPVSELTNLTQACFGKNLIEDLSPLKTLVNLNTLEISHNNISDLSPVGNLPMLTNISANNNKITDITGLASLSLRQLDLQDNLIEDASPLAKLDELKVVNLNNNPIENITSVMNVFDMPIEK